MICLAVSTPWPLQTAAGCRDMICIAVCTPWALPLQCQIIPALHWVPEGRLQTVLFGAQQRDPETSSTRQRSAQASMTQACQESTL